MTAMARASLTGTDLHHWIALRRVLDGGVTRLDGRWRDHGHLVPGYVIDALDELLTARLIQLAKPDPTADGMALAALTNAGTARFEQLCRTALDVPASFVRSNPVLHHARTPVGGASPPDNR